MENVLYPAGDRQNTFKSEECDEVLLIITPVATCTLNEYVQTPLKTDEFLTVASQALSSVAYIHLQGIMHRDIKPANIGVIVMKDDLKIVLLDFGVAIKAPCSTDHFVGTVRYLAPEIIALKETRVSTSYTNSADIWALGLSLFEVLSRKSLTWERVNSADFEVLVTEPYPEATCSQLFRFPPRKFAQGPTFHWREIRGP